MNLQKDVNFSLAKMIDRILKFDWEQLFINDLQIFDAYAFM